MRRKDREVKDKDEIIDMLRRLNTIRLGISNSKAPYIIPISFGFEIIDEKIIIYFHSAKEGQKIDLLSANPNVCIEGDIFIKTEKTERGITARYLSIIAFGKCELLDNRDIKVHALKVINSHYGYSDYPVDSCTGLNHIYIGKIMLDSITGKKNLSK